MSYGYSKSDSTTHSEVNLVEQILDQGQRLRNAMVHSILSNDPFYNDYKCRDSEFSKSDIEIEKKELSTAEKHRFVAYLKGDLMSQEEEKTVLNTFRSMSNADICEITERSYSMLQNNCDCDTCRAYFNHCLNYEPAAQQVPPLNLKSINRSNDSVPVPLNPKVQAYLKCVDTLKVAIHSLKLNYEGNLKVSSSFIDKKSRIPQHLSQTFFIEYDLPHFLIKSNVKKSKIDSGLDTSSIVRLCSKKLHNEAIYFKQISLHDINIDGIDLDLIEISFQISCRTLNQKNPNIIGFAKFNMGSFKKTKYLSCNQELVVVLNVDKPIVLGTLKISLQLGCGRIFFGKEFIDAISNNKENNILPETTDKTDLLSDTISEQTLVDNLHSKSTDKLMPECNSKRLTTSRFKKSIGSAKRTSAKIAGNIVKGFTENRLKNFYEDALKISKDKDKQKTATHIPKSDKNKDSNVPNNVQKPPLNDHKTVLFGFIYISEAEFLERKQKTYFTCQPFCQDDIAYSTVVGCTTNPLYNFYQTIPIIYEDLFITKLRDNYMVIEFWEKNDYKDELIGICKIPLHQYYLAFRNSTIAKYLERNKLPVIGTDWHEPIQDPITGELTGKTQILVALGSQEQINNLETERGFRDNIVTKAKKIIINKSQNETQQSTRKIFDSRPCTPIGNKTSSIVKRQSSVSAVEPKIEIDPLLTPIIFKSQVLTADKATSKIETIEIGTQSDAAMEPQLTHNKDILGALLEQLITHRPKVMQEVATNTEAKKQLNGNEIEEPYNVKKTSDLFDTLQHSLDLLSGNREKLDNFKAHVVIESALHLPARKKCTAKKMKGKPMRQETLPSTYVTFETGKESEVKSTQIVPKNKSPRWNFKCDVELPLDLLSNNQKRLIFKVWKKSNCAVLQPNVQVDTVLGFAALDLTVLAAGLPTVDGWFNIVDFSGKCNGQIKIHVSPLENVSKNRNLSASTTNTTEINTTTTDVEEPGELLGRTLKRKFTELDEITQRLRSRLSTVTNDELSDTSNDEVADEFENDINTLCVEEDYQMIDFVKEAQTLNMERVSTSLRNYVKENKEDNQTLMLSGDGNDFVNTNIAGSSKSLENMLFVDVCDDDRVKTREFGVNTTSELLGATSCDYASDKLGAVSEHSLSDSGIAKTSSRDNVLLHLDSSRLSSHHLDSDCDVPALYLSSNPREFNASSKVTMETTSTDSLNTLDKQLVEGKQRIDTLLQKLTLISGTDEPFASRYVSGCSATHCVEQDDASSNSSTHDEIMRELGIGNFDASRLFDACLMGKLAEGVSSSNSLDSFTCCRDAPDGEGPSDDKKLHAV